MKAICCIFLLTFLTLFTGCQDEDLGSPLPIDLQFEARAITSSTALVQNADKTWTASQRVPLVGEGRIQFAHRCAECQRRNQQYAGCRPD